VTSRPNILLILADDIGTDAFRIDPAAPTKVAAKVDGPNGQDAGPVELKTFSRLLQAGVHLRHAWAHPACTPTRASLWTGLHPWRTGLGFPTGGSDDLPETSTDGEPLQTLAQALDGYACAMFGKWDLGTGRTPVEWGWDAFTGIFRGGVRPDGVRRYGFPPPASRVGYERLANAVDSSQPDKCKAAAAALAEHYDLEFLRANPDLRYYIWEKDTLGPDGKARAPLPPGAEGRRLYITEDQVEDAKHWIRQQGAEPWCVALSLVTPHDPFHLPPPGTFSPGTVADPANPTIQEMLVAMLESMDHYVNDLLDAIDDHLDNTVIVFVGDNGTQDFDPETGESVDEHLGDDKGTASIGGIHVPMIVTDGALLKGKAPIYVDQAPASVAAPVHIIDIYNTILDIAGVSARAKDSISFTAHLRGGSTSVKRGYNFSQMFLVPGPGNGNRTPGINGSVCDGSSEHKLTCQLRVNQGGAPVDRQGQPTETLTYDYLFSLLNPEPGIPGSLIETEIPAIAPNSNGTFRVTDLAYEETILALYDALSRERPTSRPNDGFPAILASPPQFPDELLGRPVLIENTETSRYLFSDGSKISGDRGSEGGWAHSPAIVGADANYYNRARWIIRKQGHYWLLENQETGRYLFSTGPALSKARGGEGGWKASSGFESPGLVGVDANYYNRALWMLQKTGDAFFIASVATKRYVLSDGPKISGQRGAEGGWKASSGFESPAVVGADANYYNRARWRITAV
jgi:arylsulfatase A-like enzyme